MKKKLLFTTSLLIGLLLVTYPEVTKGYVSGSPGGKTNSPIDGSNCTGCHNATLNNGQGSVVVTSNMPNNEYVPGQTYTITVTASHPTFSTYGFELTAENGSSKAGDFIITNSSQTKLLNGGAVTHKMTGTLGSSTKTWSVDWIPPSSFLSVDFYVCAITANGDGGNSGDQVHTNVYTVTESSATAIHENKQLLSVFYSDGKINIDATNKIELINIYNINGQLVKSINSDSKIISTSDLSEGIYIVKLSDVLNNKSTTKINIY
ncbi:MAG: T9SS type A sorting domain-containing protein [Flavobacteriales bacterium]|nr:T9SS type A sorting domain-containing protein [Flavobacteriales bacterium]